MKILCPHCHADESRCDGVLPECRARRAATQRLYAAANGFASSVELAATEQHRVIEEAVFRATAPLRAENARLRAELSDTRDTLIERWHKSGSDLSASAAWVESRDPPADPA